MNSEEKDIALIEDYFGGELSETEKVEVEKRMASDADFNQLASATKELIDGIRYKARQEMHHNLKAIEDAMPPFEMETGIRPLYSRPWVLGIAASIALLICCIYLLIQPTPSNQELYAQHFEVYPNIIAPTVRGAESAQSAKEIAFFEYDQGNYAAALDLLQQLPMEEDEGAPYLYMGICQLILDNNTGAIEAFQNYKLTNYDSLLPQVNWYLGLTYLRMNQPDNAKMVWSEIPPGNTYYLKAKEMGI